jgi:hypothetical protein
MLPALIVGGLTAWYLGLRAGIIAAIVTALAMLVAMFVPGANLVVYGLVIAWSAAVYFLGSKITARTQGPSMLGAMTGQLGGWVRNLMKKRDGA